MEERKFVQMTLVTILRLPPSNMGGGGNIQKSYSLELKDRRLLVLVSGIGVCCWAYLVSSSGDFILTLTA